MKLTGQIFMPEMVRQLMAGNKTRTSRLITNTNTWVDGRRVGAKTWKDHDFDFSQAFVDNGPSIGGNPGPFLKHVYSAVSTAHHRLYATLNPASYDEPFYLWVREKFIDLEKTPVHGAGSEMYKGLKYWYFADNDENKNNEVAGRYTPSIHMPYTACRTWLKVTGFKVERIQSISAEDAIAEGIEFIKNCPYKKIRQYKNYSSEYDDFLSFIEDNPVGSFATLWEKVHPGSWQRNDWVWAPIFHKVTNAAEIALLKAQQLHFPKSEKNIPQNS